MNIPSSETIEAVLARLLEDVQLAAPATKADIDAISAALHGAKNYVAYQGVVQRSESSNSEPGHESCIAIQAGFLLGLRCAQRGRQ